MNKIEIMSPAGSWESLRAAVSAGANSVYFGVGELNMRARSALNFKVEELPEIVNFCKKNNVKTYLTVNIVFYDEEIKAMKDLISKAKSAGVTAVIASDLAAIQYAHSIGMEVHISTQANVSNIEAVKFFSQFADVVVLARELTLEQIKNIHQQIKKQKITGPKGELIKIELFCHGALCVSISGKCYMSLASYNKSANRGECLQVCRRAYKVTDLDTDNELEIDNNFIMSPKDLCTIGIIDKLMDAGVTVLKIEGRGRSSDYVDTVTRVYREAVASVENKTYNKKKIEAWTKQLESVFNRGLWQGGYYLGKKLGEWSGSYGSKATNQKILIGRGKKYFPKAKVGEFQIESGELKVGDNILITGQTTGILRIKIDSLYVDGVKSKKAKKGDLITIPTKDKIRKSDKLFLIKKK